MASNSVKKDSIFTVAMTIATVAMAIATAVLAFETHTSTNILAKQLRLISQPYLAIQKDMLRRVASLSEDKLIVNYRDEFHLENVGQVPVKFKIEDVKLNGRSIVFEKAVEYILFPKQQFDYWSGWLENKPPKAEAVVNNFDIKIIFWVNGISEEKFLLERECSFDGVTTTFLKDGLKRI